MRASLQAGNALSDIKLPRLVADRRELLKNSEPVVHIRLDDVKGSAPREAGAFMLVGFQKVWGTIGGGQLEYLAIHHALDILSQLETGLAPPQALELPLGPELGQCCGGRVNLDFKILDQAAQASLHETIQRESTKQPWVHVFGAGHVGRALVQHLTLLPLNLHWSDSRSHMQGLDWPNPELHHEAMQETVIRHAPSGSAFVIATHDHGLDYLLAAEALKKNRVAYVGLIGSKTKRTRFRSWLMRETGTSELEPRLICPIGAGNWSENKKTPVIRRDKRPEVIAVHTASEIMHAFAHYESSQ